MSIARRAVSKAASTARTYRQAMQFNLSLRARVARASTPLEAFSGVDDAMWFWLNTAGCRLSPEVRALLPSLPPEDLQIMFTGAAGDQTLAEAHSFSVLCRDLYRHHAGPVTATTDILDFGCGWGRILRFFLKDVEPSHLVGADHAENALKVCRETNRWCQFELIEPEPPTPFKRESFDLIYCFSVFSHLPEDLHLRLLAEFRRLLRPGGILIATTRGRDMFDFCESLRNSDLSELPASISISARAFPDADAARRDFDAGRYCYHGHGFEERWSFWGEACIPGEYVFRRWSEHFQVLDYVDDRSICAQNVIVARR